MARHVVRSTRPQRRESIWLQFQPTRATIVTTSASAVFSLNAEALALRPFTIVRTRMMVHIQSDQATGAEEQSIGVGGCVVSDEASAIGVTALPTPITSLGSELWFWLELMQLSVGAATGAGSQVNTGQMWMTDSKAMRRVQVGQDILIMTEGAVTNDGALVTIGGRMLLKLH